MRHLLFIVLFLLAQAGALAHGVSHIKDQTHDEKPACEQCLAYAPMGAAVASMPLVGCDEARDPPVDAVIPTASPAGFRPTYQSRAPPQG